MSRFVLTAQLQLQAPSNVGQVVKKIQAQLNNVNVKIEAQGAAKSTRQVQQLTKAVKQADSAAFKLGKTFTSSLKRFAAFSIATRFVSLFTQGLGGAVDEAIKFERELIKVAQVTGRTIKQLSELTDEITSLSKCSRVLDWCHLHQQRLTGRDNLGVPDHPLLPQIY